VLAQTLEPAAVTGWLTFGVLVYGLVIFRRGGGATALNSLETANRVLEQRVKACQAQADADAERIAALQASRDVTAAIRPLAELVAQHDAAERAQHAAIVGLLDAIADRLGAEGTPLESIIPE